MTEFLSKLLDHGRPKQSLYFVHIPKTAGTAVTETLAAAMGSLFHDGGHTWARDDIKQQGHVAHVEAGVTRWPCFIDDPRYRKSISFAVIRNPFEWILSYYFHNPADSFNHSGWASVNGHHGFGSLSEFLEAYLDPSFQWHVSTLHKTMLGQLFDVNGRCRIDFIFPQERLPDAVSRMSSFFGFGHTNIKTANVTETNKNLDMIGGLLPSLSLKFAREMALFGYSIGHFDPSRAALPNDGIFFDPRELRYDLKRDVMQLLPR